MSPKSAITLCITAIIYVIMAAVAIVSPHGDRFASASATPQDSQTENTPAQTQTPDTVQSDTVQEQIAGYLLITDASGVEVKAPMDGMKTFSSAKITLNVNGQEKTFTAAHFKSVMEWSGLSYNSDWVVLKGKGGTIFAVRAVDLEKADNAFIIYADENGNPLNADEYGEFCVFLKEGSRKGFFKNIDTIDFG